MMGAEKIQRWGRTTRLSFMIGTCALAMPAVALPDMPNPAPVRPAVDQNHVDLTTGSVILTIPELKIGPDDIGLALSETYSAPTTRTNFDGVAMSLRDVAEAPYANPDAIVTFGDTTEVFDWPFGGSAYVSQQGNGTSYWSDPGGAELTLRDGTKIFYGFGPATLGETDPYQYYFVSNVTYPNGMVLTYHYDDWVNGKLRSITSNTGYQLHFEYAVGGARTKAVGISMAHEYCAPMATTCTLTGNWPTATYSSAGITDAGGGVTKVTSNSPWTTTTITSPENSSPTYQYSVQQLPDQSFRVITATVNGATWNYSIPSVSGQTRTQTVADPLGKVTSYAMGLANTHWRITSTTDPLSRTTTYQYPCTYEASYGGTLPEGNSVTHVCDQRGNITQTTMSPKSGSGLSTVVTSAQYPSGSTGRNTPDWTRDGKNNQTDYTYHAQTNMIETETLPAVNGVRPQKRYSYEQRYGNVLNASGTLVQAASPVWMPKQIKECRTTSSCAGNADEVVTTFEYGTGAQSLLVRGKAVTSEGVTLRTCYSYDKYGNRISETAPRAGLATCP